LCFALSLGHLLSITFIDQAHVLNYLLMTVLPVVGLSLFKPREIKSV